MQQKLTQHCNAIIHYFFLKGSLVAQVVKSLPAMQEAWFDPWVKIPWRRKWQPSPVFLPGEAHEQRSLAGYSPWDRREPDTTEQTPLLLAPEAALQMTVMESL